MEHSGNTSKRGKLFNTVQKGIKMSEKDGRRLLIPASDILGWVVPCMGPGEDIMGHLNPKPNMFENDWQTLLFTKN